MREVRKARKDQAYERVNEMEILKREFSFLVLVIKTKKMQDL